MMDAAEVEENLFAASDAKLHGEMCKALSIMYCKVSSMFPSLEAAKPRSKSGIEALCSLHVALEKAKNVLQHCSECSKLYLAITADTVLLKSQKAKSAIKDSLKQVEDIVPRSIACQCQEIVNEFDSIEFALDPLEKQVGGDLIALLQQGRQCSGSNNDGSELECFHQCAIKLGITSSREALTERRALKKLIERARAEEDEQKETIVAYLLHLMRKYSKLFKSEISDDNDSQGSAPCSPTTQGPVECSVPSCQSQALKREISKRCAISLNPINRKSGQIPLPPRELRCPISLQLMYDPVIIVSGQTYERVCIEKWFRDGHNTCPKTQQKLEQLLLIPNYCVKGLVITWCEQNGVSVPDGPPESFDINYSRLASSEPESTNSKSVNSLNSCKLKGVKVVPLEESSISEESRVDKMEGLSAQEKDTEQYLGFLKVLVEETNYMTKCNVVEQLRILLRDNEEARNYMGAHGLVEALLRFLKSAVSEGNQKAQESGAMALFNLAVNNNRNKAIMLSAGVLPLLEEISSSSSYGYATALYLNLSCLEEAKTKIGKTHAVQFLIHLLQTNTEVQCKQDSLHALYNLSTVPSNIPNLISSGIISGLSSLLSGQSDNNDNTNNSTWTEKCIHVLINLAASHMGKEQIVSAPGLINILAKKLESSELLEQEQAVSCLLVLCNGYEKCSRMVLREGIIPALVLMSVNGTPRGKEKAQKLLMLFREQRQRDPSPVKTRLCPPPVAAPEAKKSNNVAVHVHPPPETKPVMIKSLSRRIIEKPFRFFSKSKSYSIFQI
ncbi:U-box domain-containing protein 6-like [Prosopis cineraria]|uniref:U-box domain-containing protein 6-like n=1 Tax=Prosopis cineraria TaxID=364024 RepID=UPI00241005ED|nr:U-box domain-containing protein 6-like [Prosopis cineraria]XP_054806045.1 U-box domain-containing protein 6-like [Prosopis cineraria]